MASIFEPGRNCQVAAHADNAALLVDAAAYFRAFARAADLATHSIMILAWDFDSRTRLHWDQDQRKPPATLGDFLNYLVRRRRSLNIYILNWDYPMVFGSDREFPPVYGLGWRRRRHIHLRYDNTHPVAGSHHQKIVVIDETLGFSGGVDLTSRRWDTCEHRAQDPRRVANGSAYPPFHDLMLMVDGAAAQALANVARERWARATGEVIPSYQPRAGLWPSEITPDLTDVIVGISRTSPPFEGEAEVREVEALYLDMISRAQRTIYIENQYLTSHKIGAALAARLAEPNGPEIVIVLRLLSHGWLEEHTMHALRTRLIDMLRAADKHQRFGIYYPHVPGLLEGTCVDVHSKLIIVDDEWLRIGSANLCNRSMGMDTECDLTVEAQGEQRIAAVIRSFRFRLVAEHMGIPAEEISDEYERQGSLNAAITALQRDDRSLKRLEQQQLRHVPDALVDMVSMADPEQPVSLNELIDEFQPSMQTQRSGPAWGVILIAIVVFAALGAAWHYTPLANLITADRILEMARDFAGRWWAPLAVIAFYTPACLVIFPRPLITLFAVIAFGPWQGFLYAVTGILLAALVTYELGRHLDRSTVRRLAGVKLNRVSEVLRKRGLLAMTAVRMVPIAPFSVVGIVAGAIRIRLMHFTLGTFFGMLPGTLATTVFGDQLEAAMRDPAQINYWVVAAIVAAFAIGIWGVRKWLFTTKAIASPR